MTLQHGPVCRYITDTAGEEHDPARRAADDYRHGADRWRATDTFCDGRSAGRPGAREVIAKSLSYPVRPLLPRWS